MDLSHRAVARVVVGSSGVNDSPATRTFSMSATNQSFPNPNTLFLLALFGRRSCTARSTSTPRVLTPWQYGATMRCSPWLSNSSSVHAPIASQLAVPAATTLRDLPRCRLTPRHESSNYSLETVLVPKLATQIWAPSNATPNGLLPTAKVLRTVPVPGSSFITLLSPLFATQR